MSSADCIPNIALEESYVDMTAEEVWEDTLRRREGDRMCHVCPHNVTWFLKWQVPLGLAINRRWLSYNDKEYINGLELYRTSQCTFRAEGIS